MTANVSTKDQLIIDAYNRGAMAKEIAPLLNVEEKTVHKIWRRLGLPPRRRGKHSEEVIERVIELYKQGKSYAEIGIECHMTRGQAAGILDRRGLLKTRVLGKKRGPARPKTNQTNRIVKPPKFRETPFKERPAEVVPLHIPFLERASNQCAYLYGDDPRTMTCCGHEAYGTTSWCLAHTMIVYRPAEARERAPRPR